VCSNGTASPDAARQPIFAARRSSWSTAGIRFPARGCTPQTCGFRDHFAELRALGVASVFGLSTQDTSYQREMVRRLNLPFPVLSDAELRLATALDLPTMTVANVILLKRFALVIDDGTIAAVFYPVFPPDRNAADVIAWLKND
jgi:peroxiredoxin (alkyl hydroperoxide reductase subunit C)